MIKGKQSIAFEVSPYLEESASVVGKKEGEGPLGVMFDMVAEEDLFGENTWEEAESTMQKEACLLALGKAHLAPESIRYLFGGDLLRQGVATSDPDVRIIWSMFDFRRSTCPGFDECSRGIWRTDVGGNIQSFRKC